MNFTSNVYTGFKPYVPQNPVDAELLVGMQKEQAWDQGLQKVQGYFDSLHGLDIAKDVSRSYVQNKINDLKGTINNVAGDFSDNRVVNQIGGMAGRIASDPVVQNAVVSTATYRKGIQDINDAKRLSKDGKNSQYGAENEWDFMDKAGRWLNDGDYSSSFSDSYTPYHNVSDKIIGIIKDLDPNASDNQQPFQTDSKGNIQRDSQGNPIINLAMVEEHYKGKDGLRIKNAILSALDGNDYNQLGITGRYNYRGYTPEDIKQDIDHKFLDKKASIANALAEFKFKQAMSTGKEDYSDQIEQLQNMLGKDGKRGSIDEDYLKEIQGLQNNPEGTKAALYTDRYINGISQSFSSEERWRKYLENPMFSATMREKEFGETQRYHNLEADHWNKQMDLQWEEFKLKYAEKLGIGGLAPNGIPMPVPGDLGKVSQLSMQDMINDEKVGLLTKVEDVVKSIMPSEYESWKNNTGSAVPRESFLKARLEDLKKTWANNKNAIPSNLWPTMENILDQEKDVADNQAVLDKAVTDAKKAVGPGTDLTALDMAKNVKPETIKVPTGFLGFGDGRDLRLSSEDVVQSTLLHYGTNEERKHAEQVLKSKFGDDYGVVKQLMGLHMRSDIPFGDHDYHLNANDPSQLISMVQNKGFQDVNRRVTENLTKNSLYGKAEGYQINTGKAEDRISAKGYIADAIKMIKDQGGSVDSDLEKILANDDTYTANVYWMPTSRFTPGKTMITVSGKTKAGGALKNINLDLSSLGTNGTTVAETLLGRPLNSDISSIDKRIENRLAYSGNSTTNLKYLPSDKNAYSEAFLDSRSFPYVKQDIKADVSKDQNGGMYVTLYRKDGDAWKPAETRSRDGKPIPMNMDQLKMFLTNLTDAQVDAFFNQNK